MTAASRPSFFIMGNRGSRLLRMPPTTAASHLRGAPIVAAEAKAPRGDSPRSRARTMAPKWGDDLVVMCGCDRYCVTMSHADVLAGVEPRCWRCKKKPTT